MSNRAVVLLFLVAESTRTRCSILRLCPLYRSVVATPPPINQSLLRLHAPLTSITTSNNSSSCPIISFRLRFQVVTEDSIIRSSRSSRSRLINALTPGTSRSQTGPASSRPSTWDRSMIHSKIVIVIVNTTIYIASSVACYF